MKYMAQPGAPPAAWLEPLVQKPQAKTNSTTRLEHRNSDTPRLVNVHRGYVIIVAKVVLLLIFAEVVIAKRLGAGFAKRGTADITSLANRQLLTDLKRRAAPGEAFLL